MSEKELLQLQVDQAQASLDQLWKGMEQNLVSLKQIYGLIDTNGIISNYMAVLILQTHQNINRRRLETME